MLVTDRHLSRRPLVEAVAMAVEGGVNAVQLRERGLEAGELYQLALALRKAIQGRALLLINDRLDVALACGADGVHLPERGLPPAAARSLGSRARGPDAPFLIGRSVHSVEGAQRAAAGGRPLSGR